MLSVRAPTNMEAGGNFVKMSNPKVDTRMAIVT